MKNISLLLLVAITLFSCAKSDTPSQNNSLLKSVVVYNPVLHVKDQISFDYDQTAQLTTLRRYTYDSSSGPAVVDSVYLLFPAPVLGSLPGEYDLDFYTNSSASQTEHHWVYYDDQNRIIRDSVGANTTNNYSTLHFSYDGMGNAIIEQLAGDPQTPGSYTNLMQIDTMYIQNNNMITDYAYNGAGGIIHMINRNFSADTNPLYNETWSAALGCLFSYNNLIDFRSKNMPSNQSYEDDNFKTVVLNYVWTSDISNRVTQGVGTNPITGAVEQIYTYNY